MFRPLRLSQLLCILLAISWLLPSGAYAVASFYPGFKTLGLWQEHSNLRMDLNIWYPSVRRPSEVNYAPWTLLVARNGREVEGRFPLLLLSHDSAGTRFSHHETAAMLARSGFVVAALTHSHDNANNMPYLFSLRQITERITQLRATLDMLLAHPEISHSIDPQRVGIIGFGVGGTAALLMGGALPQPAGWKGYCAKAGVQDPYCSAWASPRMQAMMRELPLKASLADVRIKAVAAVAPAYGMLFNKEALRYFYPALLLLRADADEINRTPWHADAIAQSMEKAPRFAGIEGVDGASLMSACPPSMKKDIPELCGKADEMQRRRGHKTLNAQLSKFFLDTLGDMKDIPVIPPPPDLTPPPPPQPKIIEKPAPEKKRGRRGEGRPRSQNKQ